MAPLLASSPRGASAALAALSIASASSILAAGSACATESLAASRAPPATAALAYSGQPIDVLTYHGDNLRTGWNRQETDLTVAKVSSSKFTQLKSLAVDGDVLAQPLVVAGFKMPDKSTHDVLLVVTENNSVYAFDFATYATLWHVNLGPPQNANDVGCPHVHPLYGISATPAIVRDGAGRATVYLVSATEPAEGKFHTQLHALDLADGSAAHAPVEIRAKAKLEDGSTIEYSPANQWFRAGISEDDKGIYLAASSHCDNAASSISGWVLRYDRDLKQTGAFSTIRTSAGYELAAIWASGFAPAVDTDGSIFAITGNGNFSKGGRDWGESVLRLAPALNEVEDFFTPAAYASLNARDMDFGSGGVMLIPERRGQEAPPLAVAMGKDDVLYLLDRTRLGHQHPDDTGALQATRLGTSGAGVWGGPCYWYGPEGGRVYYQASSDTLRAYALEDGKHPALQEVAHGSSTGGYGGSLPIGSSMGTLGGTGIVWTVNRNGPTLEAYDAQALGTPIFSASLPAWTAGNPFLTPLQANGRVVVGTSKAVVIFGLAQ
ncbi:MAG TPA: hypothetical protein VH328_11605 [Burkholderiaceae bacterium]|nr:hypothetical protein [Burkholderiaceae bacterium]